MNNRVNRNPISRPRVSDQTNKPQIKEPAFRLRTVLELDMDLGYELGDLILRSNTENAALIALGRQLVGD